MQASASQPPVYTVNPPTPYGNTPTAWMAPPPPQGMKYDEELHAWIPCIQPPPAYTPQQPFQAWGFQQCQPTGNATNTITVAPLQQNVNSGAAFQQHVVVVNGNGGIQHYTVVESFGSQIALSCFVFWCCNAPFGLIAFILAVAASNTVVSNEQGARQLGRASYGMSTAGIVTTILIIVLVASILGNSSKYRTTTSSSSSSVLLMSCSYYRVGSSCYRYRYSRSYCSYYSCYQVCISASDGYCYFN